MATSVCKNFLKIVSDLVSIKKNDQLIEELLRGLNSHLPGYSFLYDLTSLGMSNSLQFTNRGKSFGFLLFNCDISTLNQELLENLKLLLSIVAELLQKIEDHETSQKEVNNLSELAAEKIVSFWESERVLKEIAANYPHSYVAIIEKSLMASFISGQEVSRRNLNENNNLGISLEEILVEFSPLVRENFFKTFKGMETVFEIFYKNNYFLFKTVPLINDYNEINRILTVVENITERKINEEKNRENEFFLQESQRIARVGHYIFHIKSGLWECSDVLNSIFGIDESYKKDFAGLLEFLPFEQREEFKNFLLNDVFLNKTPLNREISVQPNNSKDQIWIQVLGELSLDFDKNPIKLVGTIQDITERKKFEDGLASSLKDKELLLKELYHRTKNNMQVISSMINLRMNELTENRAIQIFEDTKNKIQAMAMVHQKLYQSKNLSNINLREYLQDLIKLLKLSFRIGDDKILFDLKAEEVEVSIDIAVPCGLILNELITNAIKHAFPGDRNGIIDIQVIRKEKNLISITIHDNGKGLPENFDMDKSASLGLKTVVGITLHQLSGNVKFENRNGTFVELTIKDNFYKTRI